jgi:biopolymer transport protein ExbB
LLSILQAAGWPIIPLLLVSIVALALIAERLLSLRVKRIAPPSLVDEVIGVTKSHLPTADTISKLADNSLLGWVLAEGFKAAAADPRVQEARLRQVFESAGRDAVHAMERYLNALGTIASAAPMMGLLGTVVGMIEIFGAHQANTNQPAQLAHGISVALYNTAFGLVIAIPALLFWRYFRARVDRHLLAMEVAADRFAHHLAKLRR